MVCISIFPKLSSILIPFRIPCQDPSHLISKNFQLNYLRNSIRHGKIVFAYPYRRQYRNIEFVFEWFIGCISPGGTEPVVVSVTKQHLG